MLSYEEIKLHIKSAAEKEKIQLIFNLDNDIKHKKEIAIRFQIQLEKSCLATYLVYRGHMGLNSYTINEELIRRLTIAKDRLIFTEYNNLFTLGTGSKLLFGTHHLVQLEQGGYFIAVDVAAEQYLRDSKTAAEITIATSYEKLLQLLIARFGLTSRKDGIPSWMKNELPRNEHYVHLLQQVMSLENSSESSSSRGSSAFETVVSVEPRPLPLQFTKTGVVKPPETGTLVKIKTSERCCIL